MIKKIMTVAMVMVIGLSFMACEGGKQLVKRLDELQNKVNEQESKIEGAGSENKKLQEKIKELEKEIEQQQEEYRQLTEENAVLGNSVNKITNELNEAKERLKEYQEQVEYYRVVSQYDLSDPKEYWQGNVEDYSSMLGVVSYSLLIQFRKTASYPIIDKKMLKLDDKFTFVDLGLAYIYEDPKLFDENYWQSHDIEEFRQTAWIITERSGGINKLIEHLEKLEFIKSVQPFYLPDTYLDKETAQTFGLSLENSDGTCNG